MIVLEVEWLEGNCTTRPPASNSNVARSHHGIIKGWHNSPLLIVTFTSIPSLILQLTANRVSISFAFNPSHFRRNSSVGYKFSKVWYWRCKTYRFTCSSIRYLGLLYLLEKYLLTQVKNIFFNQIKIGSLVIKTFLFEYIFNFVSK